MPCIRRLYNYGIVYLKPEPIGKFRLVGQTVDVVTRTDEFRRIDFAGFVHIDDAKPAGRLVKIINVSGYSHNECEFGPWLDYGREAVLLGYYIDGQVWLALQDGLPISWCELPRNK
jgi:hypothetical protein